MENKSEHVKSSETETESRRKTFFRFKEEVDNSEKNARNGKNIMRIKKWSIVPGPIHQNNSLLSKVMLPKKDRTVCA